MRYQEPFQQRWAKYLNPVPPSTFAKTLSHLTTTPAVFTSTLIYLSLLYTTYIYTANPLHHPLPSVFRTLITWNSRLYSTFCFLYLLSLLSLLPLPPSLTPDQTTLRYIYHATKLYEYLDVPLVLLTASKPNQTLYDQPIDLHFFIHHLTTPYLTLIRLVPPLPASYGWKIFPVLNKFHHWLMYAYLGGLWGRSEGDDWGRRVLQVTGIMQLVGGIFVEVLIMLVRGMEAGKDERSRSEKGDDWRNVATIVILGTYLALSVRETKIDANKR